ncbi:CACTA en-spm transposon protein [Cucumis melo var. makuwa]|uniref:CACTA en-spm transposon protein n=1 Tax=Cucumis melo var. makuwa TaxID=1194695 RepID=A0A5D3D8A7_CUCMM|nr:CACTA en-spm transposon protein [Cucumis melo var. makuwa]
MPMSIAPDAKKPILPHAVQFSLPIGVCVRKIFSVCCLRWVDVGREYIKIVKGDLQEQSQTNKATRQKQPYNHSRGSKSFLQRQHELAKQRDERTDRVELLHIRADTFVLIKYWSSSSSLPQRVLSHSLGMRYGKLCWIDDRTTQKALVGDLSPSLARRVVLAVPRSRVHNPW